MCATCHSQLPPRDIAVIQLWRIGEASADVIKEVPKSSTKYAERLRVAQQEQALHTCSRSNLRCSPAPPGVSLSQSVKMMPHQGVVMVHILKQGCW